MEDLMKKIVAICNQIQTLKRNYDKTPVVRRTRGYVSSRIATAQPLWESVCKNDVLLRQFDNYDDSVGEPFVRADELYSTFLAELSDRLNALDIAEAAAVPAQAAAQPQNVNNVAAPGNVFRLPQISIPQFSGDYANWSSFKDMFTSLIHNNAQLTNVQKLHYLKSNLRGQALNLLRNTTITNENYEVAWTSLQHRYANKRALVDAQLKILCNQPSHTSESATHIRELIDTTQECLHALRGLEIDVTTWDPLLLHFIVQRLHKETHKAWELTQQAVENLPTFAEFIQFMENRFRMLESLADHTSVSSSAPTFKSPRVVKSHATFAGSASKPCPVCGEQHYVRSCPTFLNMSISDRKNIAKQKKVCFNCLVPGHFITECNNQAKCQTCHRRHHTLLHESQNSNTSSQHNTPSRPTTSSATPSSGVYHASSNYVPSSHQTPSTSTSSAQHPSSNYVPATNHQSRASTSGAQHPSSNYVPATNHQSGASTSGAQHQSSNYVPANHYLSSASTSSAPAHPLSSNNVPATSFFTAPSINPGTVLLATALIKAIPSVGQPITLRALIDNASQATFVTENAAQLLRLKGNPIDCPLTGIGNTPAGKMRQVAKMQIKSSFQPDFMLNMNALIINKISTMLPPTQCPTAIWPHIETLVLADPGFNMPGPIDVLLGADVLPYILQSGLVKGPVNTPMAQNSVFGWIVFGPTEHHEFFNTITAKLTHTLSAMHVCIDIDDRLKSFWEIEEIACEAVHSEEETRCEQHYVTTHKRTSDGRYIVRLPLRDTNKLGESQNIAVQRFAQLERRLNSNPSLKKSYIDFMREYISLGHMHAVETSPNDQVYYIPHHAVFKDTSTTTKVRVVFDASSKSSTGNSLNDLLMIGPKIQDNLSSTILRWRMYPIAFTADIEKMYRQILVDKSDQRFQHIMWREEPEQPLIEYALQTVTYGTSCAPHLAVRTLQQLSIDESSNYPVESQILKKDFYVDDLMSGAYSEVEAIHIRRRLCELLARGGFKLRKWVCNRDAVLNTIPTQDREIQQPLNIEINDCVTALGMKWNPATDNFTFTLNLPKEIQTFTKRNILSDLSKLFDPLGWLAPIIVRAKMLMQQLWVKGVGWDDVVPDDIGNVWQRVREDLFNVSMISINRWICHHNAPIELHGFSDASQHAYAAAVYARIKQPNGEYVTSLIVAKTRVAPLRQISIPRLELCGAVLLAKLLKDVQKQLGIDDTQMYAWTDSTITLHWIHAQPHQWKTFVANRVSEIQQLLPIAIWRHVPTASNPADCASRGMDAMSLQAFALWWNGPSWLKNDMQDWPQAPTSHRKTNQDTEERKKQPEKAFVATATENELTTWLQSYSSIGKLVRISAYCRRVASTHRKLHAFKTITISAAERRHELQFWIKTSQKNSFHRDIEQLTRENQVAATSNLRSLNPFLDEDGILRVGGRLEHASMSFDEKHPIILHHTCHLSTLIIRMHHLETLHGGIQLVLAMLRKKYWIVNARNTVRSHIHKCATCHRHKAANATQLMGQLPAPRVNISRAFSNTGVDYAGPIDLRISKGRGTASYKGYIAIFICLCTKAIHLEAVSDLSSAAFIAAYRRFVARRGLPIHMYSDNGTNFVGAVKMLRRSHEECLLKINSEIIEYATNKNTEWHFIPPSSPHFGGLWEAGVKSMKHHLHRNIGNTRLTFEELATLITQIEACLNSRPLAPLTTDPNDITALTPGHFLTGDALLAAPDSTLVDETISVTSRWQLIQRIYNTIAKRWQSEYLSRLQQRPKWTTKSQNIQINDLVLIKEASTPPSHWPLARVIEVHPGTDGIVRVVTVRTAKSTLKRAITKICPLPY